MTSTYLRVLLIAMLALALIAAGCSSNDDDGGDGNGSTPTTAAEGGDGGDNGDGGDDPTEPAGDPTEPADDPTEPADDPTEPSDGGSSDDAARLQRAVARAQEESELEDYRFEMNMTFEGLDSIPVGEGAPEIDFSEVAMIAEGRVDAESMRSHMTMSMTGFEVEGFEGFEDFLNFEMIQDGATFYMKNEFLLAFLGGGDAEWISFEDPESLENAGTLDAGGLDAQSQILILQSLSSDFEVVGEETIRGVSTTHYRVVLDADELREQGEAQGLDPETLELYTTDLPLDIWLDDEGRPHRMQMTFDFDSAGQLPVPTEGGVDLSGASMSMAMEFLDYGVDVTIEIPDPATVVNGDDFFSDF